MNINDILFAIQIKLQAYFTQNNINAEIVILPDEVDVSDDEMLYVYLDIDNRKFIHFSTNDYIVQYDVKIGLAMIADSYADFVGAVNSIEQGIAELLLNNMLTTQVSIEEYAYDKTTATGFCALVASIGVGL